MIIGSIVVVRNHYNKHTKGLLLRILIATIKWTKTANSFIMVVQTATRHPDTTIIFLFFLVMLDTFDQVLYLVHSLDVLRLIIFGYLYN